MSGPETLSAAQIGFYRRQGYLLLEGRDPDAIIAGICAEIARVEDEARTMTASNQRIDLEDSHRAGAPRLRRIKLPHTSSRVVRDLMMSDHVLAPVRIPLPPPQGTGSIYEMQGGLKNRAFGKI